LNDAVTEAFASADAVSRALDQLAKAFWILSETLYLLARCEDGGIIEARGVIAASCSSIALAVELLKARVPEPSVSRL
jgi:hypothetical protein